MAIIYIPGPNNEMIPATPPDTSSRFPINGDFATSASYALTSSYTLGFIVSASYAEFAATASYLLGSVANAISASWAVLAGHAITAETASLAYFANTASYAITASYALTSRTASYAATSSYYGGTVVSSSYSITASYAMLAETASYADVSEITLRIPGGGSAFINAYAVYNISTPTIIDSFDSSIGNSAKWILSINDGVSYKSGEMLSIWSSGSGITNFAEITTNSIGIIPVAMSVSIVSGSVSLIANPASGNWTIKMIRFLL